MNYMGDKEFWNGKFSIRGDNPLSAEKSLIENIKCFKEGSVLDIACGDGRNSLFLLESGFKVTGIDFSISALERLNRFAERYGYKVDTRQVDLSDSKALNYFGVFDNIIINHYRLNKEQFKNIDNHICKNGILFICGFGEKHIPDNKIRYEDLIQESDFEYLSNSFDLIKFQENKDDRGYFVTYIFMRK